MICRQQAVESGNMSQPRDERVEIWTSRFPITRRTRDSESQPIHHLDVEALLRMQHSAPSQNAFSALEYSRVGLGRATLSVPVAASNGVSGIVHHEVVAIAS